MSSPKDDSKQKRKSAFSRRGFLQGLGAGTGVLSTGILAEQEALAAPATPVSGPDAVAITLDINGKSYKATVEPRTTLLDTLRNQLDLTGAKRVCDRGTCGACTMIVDKKVMYGCTILAVDAQGKKIETIEGLAPEGKLHPVSQAFWDNDAQQCGYCTPGFVMASKAFLDRNPNPTYEQVKTGLGGNLCRCGTYVGVRKAVLAAAKAMGGKNA
jgi:aerobic-type carbon monoxide dehydrogenase small subunit (CoxS/CutS family)